ncbi:hypothetical protein, partial [Chitinophaga sp.]|uniref:hypothetical protein n=1 Tax=Chitinophaga sp. TaxID=1869181 RepID=UPI0031CE3BCA
MQRHFMFFFAVIFLFVRTSAFASPECPIISGTFPGANGTTADNSATGWYLDASKVLSTGYFAVKSNRLTAQELGGEGVWYSKVFSTAGYTDWQVAVKVTSEGDMNSSEYVKIFYKIDGGSEVLLDQRTGNFGTLDFTSALLNGSSVQLVVRIYNYNNGGTQTSKYYIEQYRVFKEKGPCSTSGITVTATAGNGGVLTCASPSLTLSATSSASGTTYSWTGPNGFTSTSQNPSVSTAGNYTVTATSASGTGTATVAVSENKVAPDLSATGGSLACAANVVLSAASAVANATYSWTGPNSFTSTTKNPTVSTAGDYTVTVTNPANGCKTSQTVTVTAGNAATTTWEENFTLSNGTSVDNGTTAWSVTKPSSSTFSVNNSEFRISGIGTTGEGVWTSGSITMTGKTSVTVSGAVRSSVTGGAVMNDTGDYADYLRFYYKLNGGSEVLFYEKKSAINNHSTTNTTFSVSIPTSSTLQIVVRARATGTDEFYYFDNVKVTAIDPAVTLATTVSGPVTCTSNAQITVTPSGTVSSYAWTGPNGFTSTTQNPTVTAGGVYTVVATLPTGCTVSATATVTENKTTPDLDASGAVLGCLTSVAISANSTVANATYSWTGPGGFTSTSKNPTVTVAGTYTVTVTNPANGCTASKSVVVESSSATATNFWLEDFTFANGTVADNGSTPWTIVSTGTGTASVQSNEFKVSYTGAGETTWSSGIIDISGKTNVIIAADLRSETASTSDAFESDDYMKVSYKLNNGAEVLVYEDYAGIGSTTTGTSKVTVSSAALNGTSLQVIVRARNSDPTERYFFDNISLTGASLVSYPTAVATVKDSLTCAVTSVTLSGTSSVSGVTYKWTGPNSFTSDQQNPVVNAAGDYILTVTNTSTGCTGKDTVTVKQFTTAPGVTVGVSGPLSCDAATVTLTASSATTGVTYKWVGPSGYTSTSQNPVVSVVGNYTVTVTNPVNGCTSSQSVTVINNVATTSTIWNEDFTLANGTAADNGTTAWSVISPSGSVFSVNSNEFRISGIGTSGEGVWTSGVIDISGKTNISIGANARSAVTGGAVMNDTGTYADYLRFYYKLNGGAEVLFAEKKSDINGHSTTYSYVSTTAALSGSTLQLVIRARATGTDEFYYVDNVKVNAASAGSLTALATVKDSLTCAVTSVNLSGSSSTPDVTYKWTGPAGFTSDVQNPAVTAPGDYILTVTNPATGCTGSDTVTVIQSITPPGAAAGVSGPLSCGTSTVTLSGSSATAGVTYKWAGPSGFTSTLQNPVVSVAGVYTLTVTNPVNGCTSTQSVTVTNNGATTSTIWNEDFTLANGTATDNGTTAWSVTAPSGSVFSVNNNEFRISGIGTTGEGVWTSGVIDITGKTNVSIGANARSAVTGGAVMNDAGTYADYLRFYYKLNGGAEVLFAEKKSDINGHSTTYSYVSTSSSMTGSTLQLVIRARATGTDEFYYVDNVKVNAASAGDLTAVASVTDSLTCKVTSVTLSGSSSTAGVTYKWTGPANFTSDLQNPVVTTPGDYILTVTNPTTGCTGSDTVTVKQSVITPTAVAAVNGSLSCSITTVTLSGSSTTSGVTYSWTGPNGFTSTLQNPVVNTPGTYILSVTHPGTGCIGSGQVIVTQDISKPTLSVTAPAVLNCSTTSVNLAATSNGTITWSGYNAGVNPITVTAAGKYYVTAKGTNGCTTTDSVTVSQDITKPTLSVTTPGTLTCSITSINLTATSNGTITWNGYNAGVNPISVTTAGKYYVTAKG